MSSALTDHASPRAVANVDHIVTRYTWIVGSATLALVIAVSLLGPPSDLVATIIMVACVAVVGLPHGAYDLEVARRLFSHRLGRWWWLCFGALYLLLALLGLLLWSVAPHVALGTLLVGGALHWGLDDLGQVPRNRVRAVWLAMSRGGIPVAAPMAFHADAVASVFSSLLGSPVTAAAVHSIGLAWLLAATPGILASAWPGNERRITTTLRVIAEPIVLLAWFAVAPPVLAFTVYFCFWHAVRHSLRSAFQAQPTADLGPALIAYARAAALPTMLTWLLAAAAAALFLRNATLTEGSWSVIFIGLFALTVPHVALEALESRMSRR